MATENDGTTTLISCRYCLTNTNEHIVQYFFSDKQDKYEKTLEDTFNIQICLSENKYVCLECQKGIKNAAELKNRVLDVQKSLLGQSEKLTLLGDVTVKEEIDYEDCFEYEMIRDTEPGNRETGDSKEKGNRIVQHNSNMKKAIVKLEQLENENFQPKGKTPKQILATAKSLKRKTQEKDVRDTKTDKEKPPRIQNKRLLDRKKNSLSLLYNSNMCLFISKNPKYACFFCAADFLDIKTLRTHTQIHKTDKITRNRIIYSRGQTLKNVDISNLECKKCSNPCKDLDELRVHLKNIHGEPFEGTEHLLVPYKIEDGFDCVICQKHFRSYMKLSIHMNCHSADNVCDKCGLPFNNRDSLRKHLKNIHTEDRCPLCPSTFPTKSSKIRHLGTIHNKRYQSKTHCPKCDMTFKYKYNLYQHMVDKHGAKKTPNICKYCNKEFSVAAYVNIHIKSVHFNLKRFSCSICGMRFSTGYDKTRHEMTHGNEKPFSCDLCNVKFKSKDSMRRHLRRKHGDSRIV